MNEMFHINVSPSVRSQTIVSIVLLSSHVSGRAHVRLDAVLL